MPASSRVLQLRPEQDQWVAWLRANVDLNWRPGEWRQDAWLFTGAVDNPATVGAVCAVAQCGLVIDKGELCTQCQRSYVESGRPFDFVASHCPTRKRGLSESQRHSPCRVVVSGTQCDRRAHCLELCRYHYQHWLRVRASEPDLDVDGWARSPSAVLPPRGREMQCAVLAVSDRASRDGLCAACITSDTGGRGCGYRTASLCDVNCLNWR